MDTGRCVIDTAVVRYSPDIMHHHASHSKGLCPVAEYQYAVPCAVLCCAVCYPQGEIPKVLEDIKALRPTLFCGVPRVFDRIYAGINEQVG